MRTGVVRPPYAKLIQGPVVVSAESLKEGVNESFAGARAPGELMAVEMVEARRYENVAEDIEGRTQPLYEVVRQVVVSVGAVVKQCPKCGLPLLCLKHALGVGLIAEETFKVVLPDRAGFGSRRELEIDEAGDQVGACHKAHFRAE